MIDYTLGMESPKNIKNIKYPLREQKNRTKIEIHTGILFQK